MFKWFLNLPPPLEKMGDKRKKKSKQRNNVRDNDEKKTH